MGQWEIQVNSQTTYIFDVVSFYGISGPTIVTEPELKGANESWSHFQLHFFKLNKSDR